MHTHLSLLNLIRLKLRISSLIANSAHRNRRKLKRRRLAYERLELRALLATMVDPTPVACDQFGNFVSVDGDIVVGAMRDESQSADLVAAHALSAGSLSVTLDDAGNLAINDSVGQSNQFSVSVTGTDLVISDANEQFKSALTGGAIDSSRTILTIPFSSVTGSITFNGAGGDDTLTVDLSNGDAIPLGNIYFSGGNPTYGPGDTLVIIGGSQGAVTYDYTNASDGSVSMSNFGTILYSGLEPIINSGTATDVIFNLPAGPNTATLGDDGTSGNGLSRLSGTTFELTDFANPTGSLTINRGSATDSIIINNLPDLTTGLSIGASIARFATASIAGAVSLAPSKALSIFASSIQSAGPITTSAGPLTLSATSGISVTKPIVTNGGVQTLEADADGDGVGTLSLFSIAEFVDPNPSFNNAFGAMCVVLTSGNVVVTSPYDDFGGTDTGAVYLFNGFTGALISTLRGSSAGDRIGSDHITTLKNGNYLLHNSLWNNGAAIDAGAVTWGSGTSGVSGVVSVANSLVGTRAQDNVGRDVIALNNGNYVVVSPNWDNGSAINAGAVTWGNGMAGIVGVVSATNSLVGSTSSDSLGLTVIALSNSNYVVRNPFWDNGSAIDAGAATWGNGASGIVGVVSAAISLVGSTTNNQVSSGAFSELTNGNYLVLSPDWDNGAATDAGAVTWGSGTTGISGAVSATNSLVGTTVGDKVGYFVTELNNGNYVIPSPIWDNGAAANAGAATWGSGTSGIKGVVSATNSLVGSIANSFVGEGVVALSNGNYVVRSPSWNNGVASNIGAVSWGNGALGIKGVVTASNSLVGAVFGDGVGINGVTPLTNGNYVVSSPNWDNGSTINAGAVTWGNGFAGVVGVVSTANSLVGSTLNTIIGRGGVTPLSNGNYLVHSPNWGNGVITNAGALTLMSGVSRVIGVVSASNSLVGSSLNDSVGGNEVTVLPNGNYVVRSPYWDNGAAIDAGAVTLGSGTAGVNGAVSAANSLIGSKLSDRIGSDEVTVLPNGNYVVRSANWDNGAATNAGAITWANGTTGINGVVSSANSLVGTASNDSVGSAVTALTNGNYVVRSPNWDNGPTTDAGAVTFGNGETGISGVMGAATSLVGTTAIDNAGLSVTALTNGNYIVRSPNWDNGTATNAGAVTWGNGISGIRGVVSAANSLVGTTANDSVGKDEVIGLGNGNYIVRSPSWDSGGITDVGAVTWGSGMSGITGVVSPFNSVVGNGLLNSSAGIDISVQANNDGVYASFLKSAPQQVVVGSQTLGFGSSGQLNAGIGQIEIRAADLDLQTQIHSSGAISVNSQTYDGPIDLGTNAAGSLGLTDAELDRIVAATLQIGDAASGPITISANITRPVATSMNLVSGGAINFAGGRIDSAGGNVNLNPGISVIPGTSLVDITTGAGTLSFNNGDNLAITVNGTIVDSQYSQLNVAGFVNLTGLNLVVSGSYTPAVGDSFQIVNSTGGIAGTFSSISLPQAPLGTAWDLVYSPNQVVLNLVDVAQVASVQFGDGTAQRSKVKELKVTFDGQVDIDTGAFSVLRRGSGGGAVATGFTTQLVGNNTVATLTYSGSFTRGASGSLVDGNYQLIVDSTKVRRKNTGVILDGNNDGLVGGNYIQGTQATDVFFSIYGDTNGDRSVALGEFNEFRSTFPKLFGEIGYDERFDFDGNGAVGILDFNELRSRFATMLPFE